MIICNPSDEIQGNMVYDIHIPKPCG